MRLVKTSIDFLGSKSADDVVLLGSWCISEDLISQRKKYVTVDYHWDKRDKYNADYIFLTNLYEKNLLILTQLLNETHNLNKNINYWRIIIGPWLRFFIDTLFDRYECVKEAKNNSDINSCNILPYDLDNWRVKDFSDFYNDLTSDEWNEVIFSECIKYQGLSYIDIDHAELRPSRDLKKALKGQIKYKDFLRKVVSRYSKFLTKHKKGVILVRPYMSIKKYSNLNLKLRQAPFSINGLVVASQSFKNKKARTNLGKISDNINFESFLTYILPRFIPEIYLESFLTTREDILKNLPRKPKAIFTAVGYQADDIFKIWAAEQKELGTPLIIGQHGGNMGLAKIGQPLDHQLLIASKFLSWGWKSKQHTNVIKTPSILLSGLRVLKPVSKGHILHIMGSLPRYFYCHYSIPVAGQYLLYLDSQLKFLSKLNGSSFGAVRIRLPREFSPGCWDLNKFLDLQGYSQYVDRSNKDIWSLIKNSRLCICTQNGTVFLQILSRNFPTVVFWDRNLNEINPAAQPFVDLLVDAEILFYSPEEAAEKVNKTKNNINEWWYSDKVQSARIKFCENFAFSSENWLDEWSESLSPTKGLT